MLQGRSDTGFRLRWMRELSPSEGKTRGEGGDRDRNPDQAQEPEGLNDDVGRLERSVRVMQARPSRHDRHGDHRQEREAQSGADDAEAQAFQ